MELNDYEREHLSMLRKANAACAVLLKRNGEYPLGQPGKLALYGSGARHTVKGGTGSGEVNGRFFTTIEQGLQDAGFTITTNAWLDGYDKVLEDAKQAFRKRMKQEAKKHRQQVMIYAMGKSMPEPEYDLPLDGDGDTALYVLSRISGEGSDRQPVKGDILLTETEARDILALDRKYPRFMLVLNVGGPVDLTPVKEVSNILLLGQLGTETGAVLADIMLGRSVPSGKLAATWAAWEDYCHIGEECEQDDTRYKEGIYVGYRYFDTVRKEPLFPFGFGLGYTDFSLTPGQAAKKGSRISLPVTVENTGKYKGSEVVQIYLSAPAGEIDRPMQELAAFQKTKELAPGESETVELCFDLTDMAYYNADRACYLLEEGDYLLRVGNSSRETIPVAVLHMAEEAVTRKVRNACGYPDFADWKPEHKAEQGRPEKLPVIEFVLEDIKTEEIRYEQTHPVEALAEKLTEEELIALNVGAFDPKAGLASIIGSASLSVPGAAGETVRVRGLSSLIMADGPAGLRLSQSYYRDQKGIHVIGSTMPESIAAYLPAPARFLLSRQPKLKAGTKIQHQYCTAIPIGMSVAQSWDPDYAVLCGDVVGAEMERFGIHLWLAPALNIHRTIRCGRNFEYYSDDPLVSGKMAAGVTRGVQKHPGCGVTIKHFAANNQETNRYNSNSIVSERAMREIYLKGFEIAIREGDPAAVMTSYNLLNGVHTSQHRGLLEDILRCEFGFGGIVMTDWVTGGSVLSKNAKHPVPHAGLVAAAGGDLFMPGSKKEIREITEALRDGRVTTEQLRINASRVIRSTQRLTKEKEEQMTKEAIFPGKPWLDTHGRRIQAHGGAVYYEDGVYFWIGENKQFTHKGSKVWSWGVSAYSSLDLINWRDEGLIIPPVPWDKKSPLHPNRRLDRPHIIFNPKTKKYVAWLKYSEKKSYFSILTADELLGPYTMVTPFYQPYGKSSGDFDLAYDEKTGEGYLFAETDHADCIVCRLNEDFTAAEGEYKYIYQGIKPPYTREGITHMERNGKHYIFSSGMTGYTPNPSEVSVADDWMGPYTVLGDPHVDDPSHASFNSQISFILKLADKDSFIAVADRWMPDALMTADEVDLICRAIAARNDKSIKVTGKEKIQMAKRMMMQVDTSVSDYVWLPIRFEGDMPKIEWRDSWNPSEL